MMTEKARSGLACARASSASGTSALGSLPPSDAKAPAGAARATNVARTAKPLPGLPQSALERASPLVFLPQRALARRLPFVPLTGRIQSIPSSALVRGPQTWKLLPHTSNESGALRVPEWRERREIHSFEGT